MGNTKQKKKKKSLVIVLILAVFPSEEFSQVYKTNPSKGGPQVYKVVSGEITDCLFKDFFFFFLAGVSF